MESERAWMRYLVKKPFSVWVLMVGLLVFGLSNTLRLTATLRAWEALDMFGTQPGRLYLAVSGGVFAVGFFLAVLALLLRWRSAAWIVRGVVVAYALWYWADRYLLSRAGPQENTPFLACLTIFLLLFALAAVWVLPD